MKRILKNNLIICTLLLFIVGCQTMSFKSLKNGDLVFITAKKTGLSNAINDVTKKSEREQYDHVGIIEKDGNNYFVLHAAPDGGSQRQTLETFLDGYRKEGQKIVQYRLKTEYQNSISNAIYEAKRLLGKPYNFDYVLNDESYYCSDFVERVFRKFNIFQLEPMTFKDLKTGETNQFWKTFYKNRNMEVPEGQLGCNPNGLAASEKLIYVGEIK